jgi:1-acyl-sn-glycerol-3-phosphate acyltransferase
VIERGVPILKAGRSIVVFPESTRTVTFDTNSFNSLGIKLAARAGVPVVPLAVKSDLLRNGRLIKDMGPIDTGKTIYFEFGAPLRVEGNGREQHKHVVSFIAERLKGWGAKIVTEQPVGATKEEIYHGAHGGTEGKRE